MKNSIKQMEIEGITAKMYVHGEVKRKEAVRILETYFAFNSPLRTKLVYVDRDGTMFSFSSKRLRMMRHGKERLTEKQALARLFLAGKANELKFQPSRMAL